MIFHDIQQNTDDWWELRGGKITGSGITKIMANEGKAFGEPAKKYAVQIAVERITGKAQPQDGYSNHHMERGHEQEPLARLLYEDTYFCDVSNGGFFDCGLNGCSPDGLVDSDGLIEIKSVIPPVHYANIKRNNVDPAYRWQVFSNLLFTERDWIDFISYCPLFPEGKQLFVYRVLRKDCFEIFERINTRLAKFEEYIKEVTSVIMK